MYSIVGETDYVPSSPLMRWVAAHAWPVFLGIFFAGVWLFYLPSILSLNGLGILDFAIPYPLELQNIPASIFGPLLATFVVTAATGGKAAVRELRSRLFNWRINPLWYIGNLVLIPLSAMLVSAIFLGPGVIGDVAARWPEFLASYLPNALLIAVLVNMWEEGGLMGWAFPQLQHRFGPIAANFILGPIWAVMHLPLFLVHADPTAGLAPLTDIALGLGLMMVIATLVRLLTGWMFNTTLSVIILAVFHGSMNATHGALTPLIPGYTPDALHLAFLVFAVALLVATRGRLGNKEQKPSATPAPTRAASASVA